MGIWAKKKQQGASRSGGAGVTGGRLAIDAIADRDGFSSGGHRLPSLYRETQGASHRLTKRFSSW